MIDYGRSIKPKKPFIKARVQTKTVMTTISKSLLVVRNPMRFYRLMWTGCG